MTFNVIVSWLNSSSTDAIFQNLLSWISFHNFVLESSFNFILLFDSFSSTKSICQLIKYDSQRPNSSLSRDSSLFSKDLFLSLDTWSEVYLHFSFDFVENNIDVFKNHIAWLAIDLLNNNLFCHFVVNAFPF